MDIAPTLLDLCGLEGDFVFHGRSLSPPLFGKSGGWRQSLMAQHYGLHERLVQRACYHGQWKYVVQEDGFEELYDLSDDPFELNNLTMVQRAAEQVHRMRGFMADEMIRTGDPERTILDQFSG